MYHKDTDAEADFSRTRLAPSVQFCRSMAMVMGPTPPGTGVMYPAFSLTSLKATSPTSLYPLFLLSSCRQAGTVTTVYGVLGYAAGQSTQTPLSLFSLVAQSTLMSLTPRILAAMQWIQPGAKQHSSGHSHLQLDRASELCLPAADVTKEQAPLCAAGSSSNGRVAGT